MPQSGSVSARSRLTVQGVVRVFQSQVYSWVSTSPRLISALSRLTFSK